eukprot:PhM_4_TR12980/c0_g1_i1/m.18702
MCRTTTSPRLLTHFIACHVLLLLLFLSCCCIGTSRAQSAVNFTTYPNILYKQVPARITLTFVPTTTAVMTICYSTTCHPTGSSLCTLPVNVAGNTAIVTPAETGVSAVCLRVGTAEQQNVGSILVYGVTFTPQHVMINVATTLSFSSTAPDPFTVGFSPFSTCDLPFSTEVLTANQRKLTITMNSSVSYYVCGGFDSASGSVVYRNVGSFSVFEQFLFSPKTAIRYDQSAFEIAGASPAYTHVVLASDAQCTVYASNAVRSAGPFGKTATLEIFAPRGTYFLCIEAPVDGGSFAAAGTVSVSEYTYSPTTLLEGRARTLTITGPQAGGEVKLATDKTCTTAVTTSVFTSVKDTSAGSNASTVTGFLVNTDGTFYACIAKAPTTPSRTTVFVPAGQMLVQPNDTLGVVNITPPVVVRGLPFTVYLTETSPKNALVYVTKDIDCAHSSVQGHAFNGVVTLLTTHPAGQYYVCVEAEDKSAMYSVDTFYLNEFALRRDHFQVGVPAALQMDNRTAPNTKFQFFSSASCSASTTVGVVREHSSPNAVFHEVFPTEGSVWLCLESNQPGTFVAVIQATVFAPARPTDHLIVAQLPHTVTFPSYVPVGTRVALAPVKDRCTSSDVSKLFGGLMTTIVTATATASSTGAPLVFQASPLTPTEVVPLQLCVSVPTNVSEMTYTPFRFMANFTGAIVRNRVPYVRVGRPTELKLTAPLGVDDLRGATHLLAVGVSSDTRMPVGDVPSPCPVPTTAVKETFPLDTLRNPLHAHNVSWDVTGVKALCLVTRSGVQIFVGSVVVLPRLSYTSNPAITVAQVGFTLTFTETSGFERLMISKHRTRCNETLYLSEAVPSASSSGLSVYIPSRRIPVGTWALCTLHTNSTLGVYDTSLTFRRLEVFPHSIIVGATSRITFPSFQPWEFGGRSAWLSTTPSCTARTHTFVPFNDVIFYGLVTGDYYACVDDIRAYPMVHVTGAFTVAPAVLPIRYTVPFEVSVFNDHATPYFYVRKFVEGPCVVQGMNFTVARANKAKIVVNYPAGTQIQFCVASGDRTVAVPTGLYTVAAYFYPTTVLANTPTWLHEGSGRVSGYGAVSISPSCATIVGAPAAIDASGRVKLSFPAGLRTQYYCKSGLAAGPWVPFGTMTVVDNIVITTNPSPIAAGLPFEVIVTLGSSTDPIDAMVMLSNTSQCNPRLPLAGPFPLNPITHSAVFSFPPGVSHSVVCLRNAQGEWIPTTFPASAVAYTMKPQSVVANLSTALVFTPPYEGFIAVSRRADCREHKSVASSTAAVVFPFLGHVYVCTRARDNTWYPMGTMFVTGVPGGSSQNGNNNASDGLSGYRSVYVGVPFTVHVPSPNEYVNFQSIFLSANSNCEAPILDGALRLLNADKNATFTLSYPTVSVACIGTSDGYIWPTKLQFNCSYLFASSPLANISGSDTESGWGGNGTVILVRHKPLVIPLPEEFNFWALGVASTPALCSTPDFIPWSFRDATTGNAVVGFSHFIPAHLTLYLCAQQRLSAQEVYVTGFVNARAVFDFVLTPLSVVAGIPTVLHLTQDSKDAYTTLVYGASDCTTITPETSAAVNTDILEQLTPSDGAFLNFTPRADVPSRAITLCHNSQPARRIPIEPKSGIQVPLLVEVCSMNVISVPIALRSTPLAPDDLAVLYLARDDTLCCRGQVPSSNTSDPLDVSQPELLLPMLPERAPQRVNDTVALGTIDRFYLDKRIPPSAISNQTLALCFRNTSEMCLPLATVSIANDTCRSPAGNISYPNNVQFVGGAVSLDDKSFKVVVALGVACFVIVSLVVVFVCYQRARTSNDGRVGAAIPDASKQNSFYGAAGWGGGGGGNQSAMGRGRMAPETLEAMSPRQRSRWESVFQTLFDPEAMRNPPDVTAREVPYDFGVHVGNVSIENEAVQVEILGEEEERLEALREYLHPFLISADAAFQDVFREENAAWCRNLREFLNSVERRRVEEEDATVRRTYVESALETLVEYATLCHREAALLARRLSREAERARQEMNERNYAHRRQQLFNAEAADRQDLADMEREASLHVFLMERTAREALSEREAFIQQQVLMLEHQRTLRDVTPIRGSAGAGTPSMYSPTGATSPHRQHVDATTVTVDTTTTSQQSNPASRLERLRIGGLRLMDHLRPD